MTLAHPELENVIAFIPGRISSAVIENRQFFRKFIMDLYSGISGEEGDAVLYDELKELELSKYAELIDSFPSFSVNSRKMQGKLLSFLERKAVSEDFYLKTSDLLRNIEIYLDELTDDFTAELEYNSVTVQSVLKAANILVREDGENRLERILDYMELTRELERDKLFIFVNLRSYYLDEELCPFLETVCAKEFSVLLIDNMEYEKFPFENRLIIDADLCEI